MKDFEYLYSNQFLENSLQNKFSYALGYFAGIEDVMLTI